MKVLIFAGGDIENYSFYKKYINQSDYIICADRGIEHTKKLGVNPSIIIGDLDSASKNTIEFYKNKNILFKTFSSKKDKTDTELALDYAINKGAKEIFIAGGIGNRLDHTLGNIHLLYYSLQRNVRTKIINEYNEIILIDNEVTIYGQENDIVSLIPFSMEVKGIYTKGLYYALKGENLKSGSSLGISNVMTTSQAHISIKSGLLLVIKSKEI
ncbi:thiamine diphosphokinase [Defluviitalea phaphyphila]|uniref:thiamine diphosphokinase n=1 Tax=Defluviitalea phaphyphila TaxID=1473580 RepID=UPI000731320C|nr:thiamine diphosphokinase [Defluviitalea phaphyphila]